MQYRTIGQTGQRVSALGFGAMRLPTLGTDAEVDEPAAIEMLRSAVDQGVNYVDTAHGYHGGNSEVVVGKALRDGYRDKVQVATKLPIWNVKTLEDCERIFREQLARLQVDRVDFYLLHCLQKESWRRMRDLGVLDWAEKVQADGRIGHFGFSFHDSYETFTEIVDAHDWAFCQIQYNYVNEDVQAGTRGLHYAAEKGLGVIVMEPLFGGTLANPPEVVQQMWQEAEEVGRPVDLALRWLWNKPQVSLVLSGMGTLKQVRENIESASRSGVGTLSDAELALIAKVQEKYEELSPVPCTKCGYCMPCPHGVNIPVNFELYNNATVYQGNSQSLCRNLYNGLPETERAKACQQCGHCETLCPQQIEIGKLMERVDEQFR